MPSCGLVLRSSLLSMFGNFLCWLLLQDFFFFFFFCRDKKDGLWRSKQEERKHACYIHSLFFKNLDLFSQSNILIALDANKT
jgi:hypothetical protein